MWGSVPPHPAHPSWSPPEVRQPHQGQGKAMLSPGRDVPRSAGWIHGTFRALWVPHPQWGWDGVVLGCGVVLIRGMLRRYVMLQSYGMVWRRGCSRDAEGSGDVGCFRCRMWDGSGMGDVLEIGVECSRGMGSSRDAGCSRDAECSGDTRCSRDVGRSR